MPEYVAHIWSVDSFLSLAGMAEEPGGAKRDCLGCAWLLGSTHHLVDWPLHKPRLGGYRLPPIRDYYRDQLRRLAFSDYETVVGIQS